MPTITKNIEHTLALKKKIGYFKKGKNLILMLLNSHIKIWFRLKKKHTHIIHTFVPSHPHTFMHTRVC